MTPLTANTFYYTYQIKDVHTQKDLLYCLPSPQTIKWMHICTCSWCVLPTLVIYSFHSTTYVYTTTVCRTAELSNLCKQGHGDDKILYWAITWYPIMQGFLWAEILCLQNINSVISHEWLIMNWNSLAKWLGKLNVLTSTRSSWSRRLTGLLDMGSMQGTSDLKLHLGVSVIVQSCASTQIK